MKKHVKVLLTSVDSTPSLAKALFVFTVSLLANSLLYTHALLLGGKQDSQLFIGNIRAIFWSLRNLWLIWGYSLKHWRIAKITPELLVTKFIRMRVPTALYLWPFNILALYRRSETSKY
jgi:hypothetical protein